jgi:hypothetical protein
MVSHFAKMFIQGRDYFELQTVQLRILLRYDVCECSVRTKY